MQVSNRLSDMQAGPLGQTSLQFTVPEGLLLDDAGDSITDASLAPSDVLTVLVAIAAATIDLRAGHQNFTLNNMIACLVATDILQVSSGGVSFSLSGMGQVRQHAAVHD